MGKNQQPNQTFKMSTFSFSFSGDDIEDSQVTEPEPVLRSHAAETGSLQRSTSSAFPIGTQLLQPQTHDLESMLRALPSKLVYSTLVIKLDDGTQVAIPRRELWDVRVQLMAEEDDEGLGNLGRDVVKVLHERSRNEGFSGKILELGCGTALPSLAVFQWLLESQVSTETSHLGLGDYNPTVLQLVTLPNILLSWAQVTRKDSWEVEGEVDLNEEVINEFLATLESRQIKLSFFSGAWSPGFVDLVKESMNSSTSRLTIIDAETIYSPVALKSFAETLVGLLASMPDEERISLVAAKKVYFGVGGSMEDFCDIVRSHGCTVEQIREESDGVRRAVVEVKIPKSL